MFKSMIKHKWISMMAVLGSVLMLGGLLAGPVLAFNDPQTQDLRMGGGDGVGTSLGDVVVTDDGTNLKVKYDLNVNAECVTDSDWELIETHIDASLTVAGIPQRNGNPPPGKFAYKDDHANVLTFERTIPLSDFGTAVQTQSGETLFVAAHAAVECDTLVDDDVSGNDIFVDETGWGAGSDFSGKNWAMYIVYTIQH